MTEDLVIAEQAVIGAVVQDPQSVRRIPTLTPAHFQDPRHALIYAAAQRVADISDVPDHIAVLEALREQGELNRAGGAPYLHTCVEACPTILNTPFHARIVMEGATRRRLRQLAVRLQQVAEMHDFEAVVQHGAETADLIESLVASPEASADALGDLAEIGEFVARTVEPYDWLIPGLLERMDRVLLVAAEGAGKSMVARQVCTLLAQGWHPFEPTQKITPKRTLLVDLENPPKLIQRKLRQGFVDQLQTKGKWLENAFVWTRPGGLDLKQAANAALLERAIEQTRPHLVAVGPLYKAGFVTGDSAERTASEVAAVLDRMREKHRVALWLEHHAPMEQGGHRSLRPFGSGLWARWPEFGLALARQEEGARVYRLDRFRGDRDERMWPEFLRWGDPGEFPWVAHWPIGGVKHVG